MRFISFIAFNLIISFSVLAQNINRCGHIDVLNQLEANKPGFMNAYKDLFKEFKSDFEFNNRAADTIYFIKVVVHIVYNSADQNLPDSVIYNQIDILNKAYSRSNDDTINLRSVFNPVKGKDTGIRFVLADIDPSGNPTNGITRTQTTVATFFDLSGSGLPEGVKSAASGGKDPWDQSRYLNIWVCNMSIPIVNIPALLGYATPPDGLPNWAPGATTGISDGVVIQYQCFGSNNPNTVNLGGSNLIVQGLTPVHEVGHYLGLRHIWGDDTNCLGDDGIDDTPGCERSNTDCDMSRNSCTDNIAGVDMPDMIENYMDYSSEDCQNSFTAQQCDFMKWVLVNFRPQLYVASLAGIKGETNQAFKVLPNPAKDILQMQLPKSVVIEYKIFNSLGKLILAETNNNSEINISKLEPGVYSIIAIAQNTFYQSKFVKI